MWWGGLMTRRGSTRRSPVRRGAAMRLAWNGVLLALLRSREATKSLLTWGERCSHRTPKSLKKLFCLVRPTKSLVVRSNCVRKGCSCIHENSGSAAISFPSLNRDQIHRETPLLIVSTFCGLRCRFSPGISSALDAVPELTEILCIFELIGGTFLAKKRGGGCWSDLSL